MIQRIMIGRWGQDMLQKLILAALLVLVGSCAAMDDAKVETAAAVSPPVEVDPAPEVAQEPLVDASAELSTSAADLAEASGTTAAIAPTIYRGNDRPVRMPAKSEPVRFLGDDVSLNFEQAPLSEVVHAIVGDILGLDYVVDHPIKGQVTLRTRTPVPRDELMPVLESLLRANNALMIRGRDNRYLITGAQGGAKLSPSLASSDSLAPGYSTIVVPLQYIGATSMADILKPLADESAFVRVDNARGILMLAGTRQQLTGWLDIVATFDVDMLKGMSVGMFPLENSEVDEVAEALNQLLEGGSGEDLGLKGMVRVIPFKRLNSVLVVSPRAHYLDIMQNWISRLDEKADISYERQLFVYPVQNTTASRLAELLTEIYSGSGGGGGGGGVRDTAGVAPGLTQQTIGGINTDGNAPASFADDSYGSGTMRSGILSTGSEMGSGNSSPIEDVRVVADEENNSLMIYATGRQYKLIRDALERLDTEATQVIIEASIMEVTLTDELKYGLEWTFKNGIGNDYDGRGVLSNTIGGPAAAVVPGFSYTVTNSIGDISAVLRALSEESLINIISTPSVMVLDNHTAYIHVGDQVPTFDQQTESDGGRITQSVTYKDTGVKLTVRPSVNAGGLVTMDVAQSVTDIGNIDAATGQRTFLERNIVSRVAVRSNESVVLGGLIRENASTAESGVPILHKLPLVGPIFGTTEKEDRRTELLIIITPRALYNESQLREVSQEMRKQIRFMELIEAPPL